MLILLIIFSILYSSMAIQSCPDIEAFERMDFDKVIYF